MLGSHNRDCSAVLRRLTNSRSLAEEWDKSIHPALSTYRTRLSSISLFVLLDLLGAKHPTVPSYFMTTHWAYKHMAKLEVRLRSLSQLKSSPNHPSKRKISTRDSKARINQRRKEPMFLTEGEKTSNKFQSGAVSDDHLPFLARGVDVLHVIPIPFPRVWHELDDDGEHLDMDTVEDWAKLVTAFVAEWMDLEGFMPKKSTEKREPRETGDEEIIRKDEL